VRPGQKKLSGKTSLEKLVHFGYQRIPEKEKIGWVLRHFNTVAGKYDLMNTLLSLGIHHVWKRTAVKMLGLRPGDCVIDVCGGTGDLSILAANDVRSSGQVILYDINRLMMETGRPKVKGSSYGRSIFYVQGDAERIPFSDQVFDAAMVGFGIRNVTHMEKGFGEMCRVLKTGGKLMCLEFSKPTLPPFRWLYDFYSFHVMPLLGDLMVGSRRAYTYLPESIRMFPLPGELSRILRKVGLFNVFYRKLTNGIAVVHLGTKM
jgi:demethylmenaquinone methyltransferase/2-methoxy-6-polyprenyl-1,4-benzoquinol methylase